VSIEYLAHECEDGLAGFFAELDLALDFAARSGVVLAVVVEVSVHEELDHLEDLHVEVLAVLHQLEILHAHVDVGQLLHVALVEVAQLHPPVHQVQRHILLLSLVTRDLVVVVHSTAFLHQLAVSVFEPSRQVDAEQYNEAEVEGEDHGESHPADVVVDSHVKFECIGVVEDDLINEVAVDEDADEEDEEEKL
jgi:hypothetical protein